MNFILLLFWVSFFVLFYCHIGYGIILLLWNSVKVLWRPKPIPSPAAMLPAISIIIPAFNEADLLRNKLDNTLAIDYPAELLQIILVTDGSTDGSELIAESYPRVKVLHAPQREGKFAAISRVMQHVSTPIVVFSDANTMLNPPCLQRLAYHFSDPTIGGVAGEKRIIDPEHLSPVGQAEGIYWQYESFLKKQDAGFHTVVGAAGELFAIRSHLFRSEPTAIILDDFIISMRICLLGYRIGYEPGAFATEYPSASLADEARRKIRISAGAYQSIGKLKGALNPFRFPLLSFQYISRRVLRWVFCPWMLILLLVANILLVVNPCPLYFYSITLGLQALFYLLALIGWLFTRAGKRAGILGIPFYFLFMNFCLVRGFIRFLLGKQSILWERSLRSGDLT